MVQWWAWQWWVYNWESMILEDPGRFSYLNDSVISVLHSDLSLLEEFILPSKALFSAASFASKLKL